jgi:fatty acid-binding protein DegV
MEEIKTVIDDVIPRTYTFAILDNLDHLQHSGRMGQFITTLGSVLKIRIMLKMNRGKPGAEQFRTMRKGLERLAELTEKLSPFEKMAFLHTNNPDAISLLQQNCQGLNCEGLNPETMVVNPVLGAHLGPTAVGFAAVAVNHPDPSLLEKSWQTVKDTARKIHLPDSFPNPFERKSEEDSKDE